MSVDGAAPVTTTCDPGIGAWSFTTNFPISDSGTQILLFMNGATNGKGALVTRNVEHFRVRQEPRTHVANANANVDRYSFDIDTDIPVRVNTAISALTEQGVTEIVVDLGEWYNPGAASAIQLDGNMYVMGGVSNTLTGSGSAVCSIRPIRQLLGVPSQPPALPVELWNRLRTHR